MAPETYRISSWLFLRGVASCFLMAFVSLWLQVDGLIGSDGILPAVETAAAMAQRHGDQAMWVRPSLFWLAPSDAMLTGLCATGVVAALLALFDVLPGPALLACWALYLSLANCAGLFLGYQWDTLLTEVGFLAALVAPWFQRPGTCPDPYPLARWALWLLFARLMFFAGWVKLASGDPTWQQCTALTWHYWTQPLPNPISWYAHHLPVGLHQLSCAATFGIELVLPFGILLGARGRLVASLSAIALMLALFTTGNYGFFQLLTIALCVSLIDDTQMAKILPERLTGMIKDNPELPPSQHRFQHLRAPASLLVIALGGLTSAMQLRGFANLPGPVQTALQINQPWRTVNPYGLFARMTTSRPEIQLEGSADGRQWRTYRFRYKPGELDRAPPFVPPGHMPRVDWQMWFAALGSCDRNPWLQRMASKLTEGSPAVLGLLAHNPFPDTPPRFIRATIVRYEPTAPGESGWWREVGERELYCPVMRGR